jgi:hypothetical protein
MRDYLSLQHNPLPNIIAQLAAKVVFKATIDGLKKYSPPRGTTNNGEVSELATFSGSIPVVVFGLLTFCPICSMVGDRTRYIE